MHSRYLRAEPQPKPRALPYPALELPLEIPNSQYVPLNWSEVTGWRDDDHLAAYKAFRTGCLPSTRRSAVLVPASRLHGVGTEARSYE